MERRTTALILTLLLAAAPGAHGADEGTAMFDGLHWALQTNGEDVPWAEANEYCEALELAGRSDWRLPTYTELEALHDPAAPDRNYRQLPVESDTCCLWSSTTLEDKERDDDFYIGPLGSESQYGWGYLYDEDGLGYYSLMAFPDGQALCVSED